MSLPVEEQLRAYFTDLDHEQEAINLAAIAAEPSSASGRLTLDAVEPPDDAAGQDRLDRASEVELVITPLEKEETMTLKPSTLLLLAAAAVIVIAGIFFAIESGSDDSAPVITDEVPVSTTATPQEIPATTQEGVSAAGSSEGAFTESNALGIVEAYYTAAEAGNADAIAATFAEAPVISGSADLAETLNVWVWDEAQGTILVDRTCTASGAESASIVVVCGYGDHQYLQRVVDAPATPITETITVTADGIEEIDISFAAPLFPANDAFNAWMRANHPEDAAAADCCGEDGSIEQARADGELRRQYADQWAAYLGENGCTYNDIGC
jgi:hypothetical protein